MSYEEQSASKIPYNAKSAFPEVVRCIDGSQVRIICHNSLIFFYFQIVTCHALNKFFILLQDLFDKTSTETFFDNVS